MVQIEKAVAKQEGLPQPKILNGEYWIIISTIFPRMEARLNVTLIVFRFCVIFLSVFWVGCESSLDERVMYLADIDVSH